MNKLLTVITSELEGYHPRLLLLGLLLKLVPNGSACRLRTTVYRAFGWNIGSKTFILGSIRLVSPANARSNISVGARCFINIGLTIDPVGAVKIGDNVSIGPNVSIITASHKIASAAHRAGAMSTRPVTVENGAWIAAGATLLPGITVGRGAVVAAGAVVTRDVPPNSLVGGVPARVIRALDGEDLETACACSCGLKEELTAGGSIQIRNHVTEAVAEELNLLS